MPTRTSSSCGCRTGSCRATVPFAEKAIERIVASAHEVGAAALFVSWRHDPHCDHQASYRLARAAQRRLTAVKLFEYTVWGAALPLRPPLSRPGDFGSRSDGISGRSDARSTPIARKPLSLISDDPDGFRLTGTDLARFALPYEFFFESA